MHISRVIPQVVAQVIALTAIVSFVSGCTERTVLTGMEKRGGVGKEVVPPARVQVWFCKADGDDLNYVAANRPPSGEDKLAYSVKELLAGPNAEEQQIGITTEIPRGTILLGVKDLGAGQVDLNLSKRFGSGGGSDSFETRIDQLTKTVAAAAGGRKVFLSVEGERLTTTGEGLEIKQPIN
jgi:spore germination protein GerM